MSETRANRLRAKEAVVRTMTGHVGINVSDLDRSMTFYVNALGLEVMTESVVEGQRFAFLTDGRRVVLSLWEQSAGRFDPDRPGLHHLAFEVASVEEVSVVEARVRRLGAVLLYDGIVAHSAGAKSGGVYFEDPDGTRLEIYSHDAGTGRHAPSSTAPTCGLW